VSDLLTALRALADKWGKDGAEQTLSRELLVAADELRALLRAEEERGKAEARESTRFVWNRDGMFSVGLKDAEPEVNFDGQKWIREEDYFTRPAPSDGLRDDLMTWFRRSSWQGTITEGVILSDRIYAVLGRGK
jgi:hypothetical protein